MKRTAIFIALFVLTLSLLIGGCNFSAVSETTTTSEQDPVSVVSVRAVGPTNPGGPTIEITLRNTGDKPIVSLKAGLYLEGTTKFIFNYPDVSSTTPFQPGDTVSQTRTLIGPTGYTSEEWYSLTIDMIFQNNTTLAYLKLVQIE